MTPPKELQSWILETIKANGPLDLMALADLIAPKYKVKIQDVEDKLRLLMAQGLLGNDDRYKIFIVERASKVPHNADALGKKRPRGSSPQSRP